MKEKAFEERFLVEAEGVAPLLQHRFSDESDSKSKGKSTRGSKRYDPKEESEKARYKTGEGKSCVPAEHLEACFTKEAVNYKIPGQGKKSFKDAFRAGVIVELREVLIEPDSWVIDQRPVVIRGSRIMRSRPRFDVWKIKFNILVIDQRVTPELLEEVARNSGKYVGIGDFRPKFGRFEITKFGKVK